MTQYKTLKILKVFPKIKDLAYAGISGTLASWLSIASFIASVMELFKARYGLLLIF